MSKDNSKIVALIEKGKTSEEIRRVTRAPMMRIAGVRAAHTRYSSSTRSTKAAARQIQLTPGSDAHKLVTALLKNNVDAKLIAAASGNSPSVIRAIKAHITMGTY